MPLRPAARRAAGYTESCREFKRPEGECGYGPAMRKNLAPDLRQFARWVFLPALVVVIWGELRPSTHGPEVVWDRLLHFTAYFGLAGIGTIALRGSRRAAVGTAFALAVFGGILEV